jgi:hypothetical protein
MSTVALGPFLFGFAMWKIFSECHDKITGDTIDSNYSAKILK